MDRAIAALAVVYAAGSLVVVVSGLGSEQPEKAASLPWAIWLGALGAILLASAALARWVTPRRSTRYWILFGLVAFFFAWLPCAGLFVLLSEMTAIAREEFRFSSVLHEIRQLASDKELRTLRWDKPYQPDSSGRALRGPGLVVVREGASVTPWSGTVGRIDRRAGKVAEIETVVVVDRLESSLVYVIFDWPRRRTVEWGFWTDIPDRYVVRTCSAHKGPPYPCVGILDGGPQWDALLDRLGGYEPPRSIFAKSTWMTWTMVYVTGIFILFVGLTIVEARALRAGPPLGVHKR